MIAKLAVKYKFLELALDYLIESVLLNFKKIPRLELRAGDRFSVIKYRDPEWKEDDEDYHACTIKKVYTKRGQETLAFSYEDGSFAVGLETRFMEFIK